MSAVDLTKCQPGDLLRLRCGKEAIYVARDARLHWQNIIQVELAQISTHDNGEECDGNASPFDVVEVIHPTRAELEEQRLELLVCLSLLHSAVNAECPSLLDEDRGGSVGLAIRIEKAIARDEGHP